MGLLSDFFVADGDDALRYANRAQEDDAGHAIALQLRPAEYKGFSDLELGTLWAILDQQEWDVDRHELELIGDPADSDDAAFLFRFPDALVQRLADASAAALEAAAAEWAATEELDAEVEDIAPVVQTLQRLAGQALGEQKSVYLWVCA